MRFVREHQVRDGAKVLGFEHDGWSRYLTIEGERAFLVGGGCDTCAFVFERLASHSISPAEIGVLLRAGDDLFSPQLLGAVDAVVPAGRYSLVDLEFQPRLVGPCDALDYFSHESIELFGTPSYSGIPDNPRIQYWRAPDALLPLKAGSLPSPNAPPVLFHFIVPMEPPHWLDRDAVKSYEIDLKAGRRPAALGLSALDVRAPAVVPHDYRDDPAYVYREHWTLATYVVDGHHKIQAAAATGLPIRALIYLSLDESIASGPQVDSLLDRLSIGTA